RAGRRVRARGLLPAPGRGRPLGGFGPGHPAPGRQGRDARAPWGGCGTQAGTVDLDPPLRSSLRRRGRPPRTELPRARRSFHRATPWRLRRRHGAGQAELSLSRHRHDPNRADDAGGLPALSIARGSEYGGLAGGAALLQAAGAAHLVRRRVDGDRRRALALGPAFARGRAETGEEQGRALAGGVGHMKRLCLIVAVLSLLALSPAIAVGPDEFLSDP